MKINNKSIKEILGRNVEQVITEKELEKKLASGKQLRIKHGVDVTSPLLHIGHAVDYWKMREFQELGHKIVFLIGDFTTKIGDPTGKSKTRPELDSETIARNSEKYLEQIKKILKTEPNLFEIRRNSEWYNKMTLDDFLSLLKRVTHSQLIERDMFQRRIKENQEIFEHELMYPILQGYDSVALESDMTIIGSDQLFNEMMGRHFQKIFGQDPQVVITTTITPGLGGEEKMSKSLNNYVAILDTPQDKFGKIMTLPDFLINVYLPVYTKLSMPEIKEIKKLKPFEAKKRLAFEIVKLYDGEKKAQEAQDNFEKTFSKKEIPENLKIYKAKKGETWIEFLTRNKFVSSKSEAKRLIDGGGVDFSGKKIQKASEIVKKDGIAKIGKHQFVKIVVE